MPIKQSISGARPGFTDLQLTAVRAAIDQAARDMVLPWYMLQPERCAVRVFHGGHQPTRHAGGSLLGAYWTHEIEQVICAATGLPSVPRVFDGPIAEFQLSTDLFARVAAALLLEFGPSAGANSRMRRLLLPTGRADDSDCTQA